MAEKDTAPTDNEDKSLVDLDKARTARLEARKETKPPVITFKGKTYELASEIPYRVYKTMARIAEEGADETQAVVLMGDVVEVFLGDRWVEFEDEEPSVHDMLEAFQKVFEAYAVSLGESAASPTSSRTTGTQRKPRSKRATG